MFVRTSRLATVSWSLATLALGACSAIVQPDPSRLGGIDAGEPGTDTGPRPDGGPIDAGLATDTGPRPDAAIDAFVPLMPDGGRDGGPVCPPSCDDGFACTADACEDGRCTHEPDDDLCPGGRCSVMLGCVATVCTTNEECDDGDRCNGAEQCDPSGGSDDGCVDGTPPDCNDGVSCTDDHCAPDTGCYHDRFDERCDDGVACTTNVCTGTAGPTGCEIRFDDTMCNDLCEMGGRCTMRGCSDTVPRVCPLDGSPCTVESCDAAAGGCISTPLDGDGDGYPAASATNTMGVVVSCMGGTDCNDGRPAINPGATEVCGNGADDDCNAATSDVCPGATGDTCATARAITLTGGTGTATVMFATLANDYRTDCGGDMGRDAVLYFDVTSTSDVRIETTGMVDTVLASATTCSTAAFAPRCNDDRNPGSDTTSRLWVRPVVVPSGGSVRVYVLVEEYSGPDPDPVTVTVTVTPPTINTCPVGSSRPLDISGGGTVLGNLQSSGIAGSVRGTCQGAVSGSEAIFRIEEPDRVMHELVASAPGFVPDLYARYGGCASSPEVACTTGSGSGGSGGSATLTDVTGTASSQLFYVVMDSFPIGGGEYTFTYDP